MPTTYPPLTADQLAALQDFARKNGRCWKSALRGAWQFDGTNAELQHMRNTHGPRWLAGFKLPKATGRLELFCRSCGRDFSELYDRADGCPAEDCPSHFEEKGIRHPDFT